MSACFAAVDLGATSGRVVLGRFAHDDFHAEEVHRFANVPVVVDGVRCWDADALFEQTLAGLAMAVARADGIGSSLAGIAVDSWGVDYGLVDPNARLVAPMRHYRAADEATMSTALDVVPADEAYARTGIAPQAINTCFQLYRDARLGLLEPGITAMLTPDLWTQWLTGERGAERTIASTTGLVDWRTGDWAEDLLTRWGIPNAVLADLTAAGQQAGVTLPDITQRIGAGTHVPVYRVGAHDTASAFAAVTSADDPRVVISCGTWALVGLVRPEPLLTPECAAAGFSNEAAIDGSALIVRNLSGTWLIDECVRMWAAADAQDAEELRRHLLAAADDDSAQVVGSIDCASPTLVGTVDMPRAIAALYSDSFDGRPLDRVQSIRLILQSLAESFAGAIRDLIRLTGTRPREVVMIGGGARLSTLVRLTEGATGLPVRVSHQEATGIGSICVQAVAAGRFSSVAAARAAVEGRDVHSHG